MICLSTSTQPMASPMSNAAQVRTHTGKYPLRSGLPFFIALTRVNYSVKLRESMASPMKQLAVFFARLAEHPDETIFTFPAQHPTPYKRNLPDPPPGNYHLR